MTVSLGREWTVAMVRQRQFKRRFSELPGKSPCNQEYTSGLEQRLHDEAKPVVAQREAPVLEHPGISRIPSFLSSEIKEISQVGRADDHVNQLSKANRQGRRGG